MQAHRLRRSLTRVTQHFPSEACDVGLRALASNVREFARVRANPTYGFGALHALELHLSPGDLGEDVDFCVGGNRLQKGVLVDLAVDGDGGA